MADTCRGFICANGPIRFSDLNVVRDKNAFQTGTFKPDGDANRGQRCDGGSSSLCETEGFYSSSSNFAFMPDRNPDTPIAFSEFRNASVLTIAEIKAFPETTSRYKNNDNGCMVVDLDLGSITPDSTGAKCVNVCINAGSSDMILAGQINPASFTDGKFCIFKGAGASAGLDVTLQGDTSPNLAIHNRNPALSSNVSVTRNTIPIKYNDSGSPETITCIQTHTRTF